MKQLLMCLYGLFMATCVKAQTMVESKTYATGETREFIQDISTKRRITGGTKLLITYEGQWDNKMKSAFEYACKIWEECIPTTLPIKIKAVMGSIRGNSFSDVLSKASFATYPWFGRSTQTVTSTQVKAVLLMENNISGNHSFIYSMDNFDFFEKPDIILTYNSLLTSQMSFSLTPSTTDKYDFVTLVLRDLAKCFGFSWNQNPLATGENGEMDIDWTKLTPFEKQIAIAINGDTPKNIYKNATQGVVDISVPYYGVLHLYAPSPWENGISLNTFIPDDTKGLTRLLTYNYGKGTIIRDVRDNYSSLFDSMDWIPDIAVGFNSSSCTDHSTTTDNAIPYQGTITTNYTYAAASNEQCQFKRELNKTPQYNIEEISNYVSNYCTPYSYRLCKSGKLSDRGGWTAALLKKDGTWDIVDESLVDLDGYNFNTNRMELHSDITEYARTCDGFLRVRISYFHPEPNLFGWYSWHGFNTYYVLDYLPQKVEQKRIQKRNTISVQPIGTEKITVGIKNLEGVDRIMVEQWEEGEIVPYKFEVQNFKDGYFNATIDNRFDNELKVISYNKNGSTISEPLVIKGTSFEKWDKDITDDNIIIGPPIGWDDPDGKFLRKLGTVSYDITPISGFSSAKSVSGECETVPLKINISSLPAGTYTLNLYMMKGKKHSIKFMKK
ncbi:MAG: hypothetical protein J6K41_03825 [Paraprevotella sp.]|nr:hypothetical protein [Paraprevotella sp.]